MINAATRLASAVVNLRLTSYAAELVVALFDRPQSYFQTRTGPLGGVQRSQPKHVALASLRIHAEARYFAPRLDGFLRGGISPTRALTSLDANGLIFCAVNLEHTLDAPFARSDCQLEPRLRISTQ